jgi:carbon monoxide dehydrogenase subunit G
VPIADINRYVTCLFHSIFDSFAIKYKKGTVMATTDPNTATFVEEIDIRAPQQRIFDLLVDPELVPRIIPHISNVKPVGKGVYNAIYTVRVGGAVPLDFALTYNVTTEDPTQVTLHFNGNIEGTVRWSLQGKTHVTARADYKFFRKMSNEVPGGNTPVMGDLMGAAASVGDQFAGNLATTSRKDMQDALQNLKTLAESR